MAPPDKTKLLEQAQKALAKAEDGRRHQGVPGAGGAGSAGGPVPAALRRAPRQAGKMKEAIDNFEKVAAVYTRDDQAVKAIAV